MTATAALEVTVTAPVFSFRNPLYAGVQLTRHARRRPPWAGCWPPRQVAGHRWTPSSVSRWRSAPGALAPTWRPTIRWRRGGRAEPTPRERDFLADVTLTVWLLDDVARWERRFRRPVWPLRLGRSQDLVGFGARQVRLWEQPGVQGAALLPAGERAHGTRMRLLTGVALDRSLTRWDDYWFDPDGQAGARPGTGWCTTGGQAVVLLPPTHPSHARAGAR